jgi:DNA-binding transcriptional regulator YiaG
MTDAALARWLGVSKALVSLWGKGTRTPGKAYVMLLDMYEAGDLPERHMPKGRKP